MYLQLTLDISNSQGTGEKFEITSSYSAWIDAKGTDSFVRVRANLEIPSIRDIES